VLYESYLTAYARTICDNFCPGLPSSNNLAYASTIRASNGLVFGDELGGAQVVFSEDTILTSKPTGLG
jgi:hypothetical protein